MTSHRPIRGWRRAGPWLAAGLVLAVIVAGGGGRAIARAGVLPEVGIAHPAVANESFPMNLTDAPAFAPRFLLADPGANVSIHLHNTGSSPHTFTLSSVSKATFLLNWTPTQLNATFNANPPIVNVSVAPGASAYANFSLAANLSFDSFEFVSVVPYQFQAGMWGLLNVSSNSPPLVTEVNATSSFSFVPAALGVEPASFPTNVAVLVTNVGSPSLQHTFTVVAQPNVSIGSISYFSEPGNTPLVNAPLQAVAGATVWANFTILKAGVYEFVCTVPGHFSSGMFGYLYAGVPVPPPAAPPSTQVVDTWLLGGSLALLGIAGLILLVATFAGRLPEPPKRPEHSH